MKKIQLLFMVFLSMLGVSAFAVGPDLSPLSGGVDFSTVITAVLAVALLGVGWVLAKAGALTVISFVSKVMSK